MTRIVTITDSAMFGPQNEARIREAILSIKPTVKGAEKAQKTKQPTVNYLATIEADGTLKVTLPLPVRALSPNGRCHWAVKSKAKKAYREGVQVAAAAAIGDTWEKWPAADVKICAYWKTKGRHDPDNLIACMKSAFDGLTKGGVWIDDDKIHILSPVMSVDKDNQRIELFIRKCEV